MYEELRKVISEVSKNTSMTEGELLSMILDSNVTPEELVSKLISGTQPTKKEEDKQGESPYVLITRRDFKAEGTTIDVITLLLTALHHIYDELDESPIKSAFVKSVMECVSR